MKKIFITIFYSFIFSQAIFSQNTPWGFDILKLDKGAEVTMPQPATTIIPIDARVQLRSTDKDQSISMKLVHTSNGQIPNIKVAIFDKNQKRVQYISLQKGSGSVYPLKNLSTISLVGEKPKKFNEKDLEHLKIQIESNRPLGVTH